MTVSLSGLRNSLVTNTLTVTVDAAIAGGKTKQEASLNERICYHRYSAHRVFCFSEEAVTDAWVVQRAHGMINPQFWPL
jgi:hypothetical protein